VAARPEQRTTAKETVDTCGTIRPDRIIICSDWPTTLRCSTTFGYKKDSGRECGREQESPIESSSDSSVRVDDERAEK